MCLQIDIGDYGSETSLQVFKSDGKSSWFRPLVEEQESVQMDGELPKANSGIKDIQVTADFKSQKFTLLIDGKKADVMQPLNLIKSELFPFIMCEGDWKINIKSIEFS